jgi:large repetitive protein
MPGKWNVIPRRIPARLRSFFSLFILSIYGFVWFTPRLFAQTDPVYYSGVQATVYDTTSNGLVPSGVAVDGNGNVYISYYYNGNVIQLSPTGSGSYGSPVTVASGLSYPYGLAVDQSGNVFIALSGNGNVGNGTIVEASPAGNSSWTTPTAVVSGLSSPKNIAMDGNGNLYVADSGSQSVKKILLTNGSYGTPSTLADTSTNTSTFVPYGVAVDGSGNVFVADQGDSSNNGTIIEIPVGCTTASCQMLLDDGMHQPQGIAVDANGNLLIADNGFGWILELPWTGSSYSSTHLPLFNQGILRGQSKYYPTSVAVDGSGNIYYTETNSNKRVEKGSMQAVDFGAVNVGSSSVTIPVSFVFVVDNTTIGSWAVLTHGVTGLDFSDALTGTCSTSYTYITNDGCTVDVTFTPQSAGLRSGAVVLKDASGSVIAIAYLHGIGTASQIAFTPGTQTTVVSSGLSSPAGITVDAGGNAYIANSGSGNVVKIRNGSQSTTGSGLSVPTDVAVDGSGNIYIVDSGNQQIVKVPWTGTSYGTQAIVISGLSAPKGVAVDGNGNLYIADPGNRSVVKLPWIASGYEAQSTLADTTTNGASFNPVDVTVDGNGNVYIVDGGNKQVIEIPWTGSGYGAQSTVSSGLSSPVGVAVDGGRNVYIADSGSQSVVKVPWTGRSYGTQSSIADTATNGVVFSPTGVATDVSGNVYIVDSGNSQVVEVNVADSPVLSFASTAAGSTSSPQTATVTNIGNTPLIFATTGSSNPLYPSNFPEYSSDVNLCTTGTSLSTGASCDVSANFAPTTAGSFSGQIALTDNALNGSGVQDIGVHGTGTLVFSPGSLPAGTVGVTYSETIAVTGGSGSYAFSVTGGALPTGLTLSASGVLSGTPTAGGNFSITITATDSSNQTLSGTQTYSLNVGVATITLSPSSIPSVTYGSSYSQTLTALGGTPTYSYAVTSGSLPSGLTLSTSGVFSGTPATGSFTFTVTATDSSSGTGPYSGSQTYLLTVNAAKPTLSLACTEVTYDGNAHSCIGTATGIDGTAVSGSWSYSPVSATNAGSTQATGTFTSSNANYVSGGTTISTLKIDAATPTLTLTCPEVTYDGNAHSCTGTATGIGGAAISGTWNYSPVSATASSITTITGTFTSSNSNYASSGTAIGTLKIDAAIPVINGVSPAFTSAGKAAFTLTVNGSGFTSGSTAYWGTSALVTQYLSSTQLSAQVTAADITFAGITDITVQTPAPGGGTSNIFQFEVDSAGSETTAPIITSTAATVTAGSTASYPVTFPSAVTSASLACLNLPSGANCSYSSSTGLVTITTSSATPTGTYQVTLVFAETVSSSTVAGILLPILLLPLVFLRRKLTARGIWINVCVGLVMMTALAFSTGCVGKFSTTSSANTAHQVTSSGMVSVTIR